MGRLWNMIFGWEEILVTDNIDQYMKTKAEMDNKGIETRTEFFNKSRSNRGIGFMRSAVTYYLYVKKDKKQS